MKKYIKPLKDLQRERDNLNSTISKLEKLPVRIIDVANERLEMSHKFDVLRVDGDPKKDKNWTQLERIFCKIKCRKCPHGDFLYNYSKRKDGTVRISLVGEAAFNHEALEHMRKEALKHKPLIGKLVWGDDAKKD